MQEQESEESLIRAAQRDPAAFGPLYERYVDRVYSYIVFRVGNPAVAEDLTSDVFLKALEKIGSYQWRDLPLSAWLFRIASNCLIDHWRRLAKMKPVPLDGDLGPTAGESDLDSLLEKRLTRQELVKAVSRLTEWQKQVIALRFAAGLPVAETAKAMGKSEGAVKDLQHSALVALRKHLVGKVEDR
ncbi:MAG: sigma-70 family RNA polymerase sigma factor [Chloroflexi bacterium]|nr:sigma-70 family RNA polymerase sigma factor [Chloroflexota bacterium]